MIKLFKIKGDSLFPLFKENEIVFGLSTTFCKLKEGDTVVFVQKNYGLMVKQIKQIDNDNFFLIGTSPSSIDSRNFGFISKQDIFYKILFKIF